MRDAEEADCPILTAAKSKINGVYALKALPQARNDPLWLEIMSEFGLLLVARTGSSQELCLPCRGKTIASR